MTGRHSQVWGWSGLFLGLIAWYGAHELSFYILGFNCAGRELPIALIHATAILLALSGALISYRCIREGAFSAYVGSGAGLLFTFVTLAQWAALLFYAGCER